MAAPPVLEHPEQHVDGPVDAVENPGRSPLLERQDASAEAKLKPS
jgi:hypothetical protein